jgi:hypothetical protein
MRCCGRLALLAAEISDEKDVSVQVRGIDNDAHSEIG